MDSGLATIQDDRVTMQQVQGRQGRSYAGTRYMGNATGFGGNNTGGQTRVVKCYNFQGEGHMARQYTQPKRPRNAEWFKAVLMANLSNYGLDVISKKAQWIKPTLYDGSVISSQHAASPVIDDEETLILEELSGYKLHALILTNLLQIEAPKELPKEHIKSMRENDKEEKVKHEMDEIETINIELEHRMFKLYIEPLSHRHKNNRDAHEDYLKKTVENTDTISGLVERARKQNSSEPLLDSACKFTKHVQELLVYVSQTCPSFTKPSEKLVAVTPMNKVKKVRIEVFYEYLQITAYRQ
ncbi:hypothetical protein Tco_1284147 [Tanacetum coccineum]